MIRGNSRKRAENSTQIPRGNGKNGKKPFRKIRAENCYVNSAPNRAENTISNEIEGKCSKTHTFPSSSESSPTQNPDRLDAFLDFGGKNPPTVTHQMHRVTVKDGKPRFFDSPELAKARADICARLEQFTPDAPFEGPLSLSVAWLFRDSRGREGWKDTKPDTDNLEKLLKDCMTRARFWIDDAQVCEERVLKMWSKSPGICIVVRAL